MGDKEIIKALEICSTYKGKCTDCPAFVKVDRSNCKQVLLGALDLINRKKADLIDKEKQLQEALKSMAVNKTKIIDCGKEITRLEAENERLKNCVKSEDEVRDIAKRTMEPLVKEITKEQIDIAVKLAKAEAYKEVFEKISDKSCVRKIKKGLFCKVVTLHDINTLKKEMVGENDG